MMRIRKKSHVYSKEERLLIDKYREKYQAATSPSQRKMIAKLEIFPELFNYWKGKGKVCNNEETERKTKVGSSLIMATEPGLPPNCEIMMDDGRQMMNDERSFATGQRPALPHYKHWVCDINLIVLQLVAVLKARIGFHSIPPHL